MAQEVDLHLFQALLPKIFNVVKSLLALQKSDGQPGAEVAESMINGCA